MSNFTFRQVHLNFHTSEVIEKTGSDFSKKQFYATPVKRGDED